MDNYEKSINGVVHGSVHCQSPMGYRIREFLCQNINGDFKVSLINQVSPVTQPNAKPEYLCIKVMYYGDLRDHSDHYLKALNGLRSHLGQSLILIEKNAGTSGGFWFIMRDITNTKIWKPTKQPHN